MRASTRLLPRLPALVLGFGGLLLLAAAPLCARIQVAVSIPPQAFLVEQVGGDRVAVQVMIPPGASPATYEPSPRQMIGLSRAALYFKVGHPDFPFERKHFDVILRRFPQLEVVDMFSLTVAGGSPMLADDPHLWVAPRHVEAAVQRVARVLSEIDPEGAPVYDRNMSALLGRLWNLDRSVRGALAGLTQRRFLVQHPAWGHFADQYGLEQVAIEEEGKEPSPAHMVDLIERARREKARVIFVQSGISDRAARTVAREIDAQVVALDPLAYDWLENLQRTADAFWRALKVE